MGPSDAVYKRNRAQSRELIMTRGTSRRSAIVADRRPLERGLARFLLEERGLIVVGEAATMADVLLQVQQLRPDVIILHEKLALDHDPAVVAQIRRTSPRIVESLVARTRPRVERRTRRARAGPRRTAASRAVWRPTAPTGGRRWAAA